MRCKREPANIVVPPTPAAIHGAAGAPAGAVRTGRLSSPPPISPPFPPPPFPPPPPPPPLSRLPLLAPTLTPPTLATGTLNMPQLFSDSPYTSKSIGNHPPILNYSTPPFPLHSPIQSILIIESIPYRDPENL